jgi:hypothetical protein
MYLRERLSNVSHRRNLGPSRRHIQTHQPVLDRLDVLVVPVCLVSLGEQGCDQGVLGVPFVDQIGSLGGRALASPSAIR